MPRFNAQGSRFEVEDPGTPGTFLLIPGMVDFNGPSIEVSEIDFTTMDDNQRVFGPGLGDFGSISVTNYPDLQDANIQRLFADINGRVSRNYRFGFSDDQSFLPGAPATGTVFTFLGFVRAAPFSGGVDAPVSLGLEIRISTSPAFVFGV